MHTKEKRKDRKRERETKEQAATQKERVGV
jgi:hypothetical protein